MRHFLKIGEGVDTFPLLHALSLKPELWNAFPLRSTFPDSPHAQAEDILLWFNDVDLERPEKVINDIAVISYPAWRELPQVRSLVFDLMRRVEGVQLGRVMLTKLAPGKCITPHTDQGAPARLFRRYQVAIQSSPGSIFQIGDERVNFRTGEAWWIDNRTEHSVQNNSAEDRIALIIDIRSADD